MDWIQRESDRQYHPVADLFPLMQGAGFDELKADIAQNGLFEAIWLHPDGRIVDGRNRHRACIETETRPEFRTWGGGGSLVAFVVSLNLHRRHLTYDQRVGIGLLLEPAYAAEAKESQLSGLKQGDSLPVVPKSAQRGRAVERAAKQAQVGKTAIIEMKAVQCDSPDLAERLISGETTVRAERKAKKRKARTEKIQEISQGNAEIDTSKRYPIIYADPPWKYEHSKTDNRKIENQYPTMRLDDICDLPVDELATPDAVLFLWATSPKLHEAMSVILSWGFTYRTSMAWVKDKIGMGYYARARHELLLIATRGNVPVPEPANRHDSVIEYPRCEHSAKPDLFYGIIEKMYPEYERIELFSRAAREGWSRWGNQA